MFEPNKTQEIRIYHNLGLLTIHDTLKSARAYAPLPFATRILSSRRPLATRMSGFLPILPVINWRSFNGEVLTNSGTFRFGDVCLGEVLTYPQKADTCRSVSICPQVSRLC